MHNIYLSFYYINNFSNIICLLNPCSTGAPILELCFFELSFIPKHKLSHADRKSYSSDINSTLMMRQEKWNLHVE